MIIDVFDQSPLFEGLSAAQLALLRPLFTPCDFYSGTMLFDQGDPAEFLYIVIVGEVVVIFEPDDGPPITVARVQPAGVVGWSAAVGSRTYTSRAECSTYTQLLRVRGTELRRLCEQNPAISAVILDRLATVIAQRLSKTHAQVVALLQMGMKNGVQHKGG
jgi:NTE family protein